MKLCTNEPVLVQLWEHKQQHRLLVLKPLKDYRALSFVRLQIIDVNMEISKLEEKLKNETII